MKKNEIHHELFIESSLEETYMAISEPKHLINWWPLACEGKPKEGEIYNFNFTDTYDWYGKVLKARKNKSFHVKVTKSDENWDLTTFGFDLQELNAGTNLRFWHVGWQKLNKEFRQSSYCWAILLKGLKDYLEKETIIPFKERQ